MHWYAARLATFKEVIRLEHQVDLDGWKHANVVDAHVQVCDKVEFASVGSETLRYHQHPASEAL